jgi:hypothetical protein
MASRESYLAFFGIWLYSFIAFERHASATISINQLNDEHYRSHATQALVSAGVGELDFSDAKLTNSSFLKTEEPFYESIENEVAQLFCDCGYAQSEVAAALAAARVATPPSPGSLVGALQAEIRQLRMLAFMYLDSQKDLQRKSRAWRMPRF